MIYTSARRRASEGTMTVNLKSVKLMPVIEFLCLVNIAGALPDAGEGHRRLAPNRRHRPIVNSACDLLHDCCDCDSTAKPHRSKELCPNPWNGGRASPATTSDGNGTLPEQMFHARCGTCIKFAHQCSSAHALVVHVKKCLEGRLTGNLPQHAS